MGYVLPGWLDEILDFIGINWPNVDEDDYREMADAMRELADSFEDHAGEAHGAVSRLLSSSEGWAVDALQEHWGKVKGSHLEQLPEVARLFADAMDVVADLIYGMKVKAEIELGAMAASAGISIGLAFVTGGLSALLGAAQITAMREVVRRIIKEAADQIVEEVMARVTEPVAAKLEDMVADAILDLAQDAISPAGGSGGGEGASGMNLNSANGPGGGGGGGGGTGKMRIDHVEYEKAAGDLGRISETSLTKLNSSLDRAHGAGGRTRGKDAFTAPIDGLVDGATKGMKKAVERVVKYTGETVPKNVRDTSDRHKTNEKANEDALRKIMGDRDGKEPGAPGKGPGGGGGAAGRKPDLLNKGLNDPRHHGVEPKDRECKEDPIDVASGQMLLEQTDLDLPGALPLVLRRTHLSDYTFGTWFGRSWASTLDERIEVDIRNKAVWAREDGTLLVYDRLPTPQQPEVLPLEGPRIPLRRVSEFGSQEQEFATTDHRTGLTRYFARPGTEGWQLWLMAIEDRNGNQIDFHRAATGMPLSVTHSGGYDVKITGDRELGRVTQLALRVGEDLGASQQVMTYGYVPGTGDLGEVTNSSGLPLRFEYDAEGRITAWTDRNESTYRYVHDSAGRVVQTIGPEGYLSGTFVYDTDSRTTRWTDALGATTVFQLNARSKIVVETDPLGNTTVQSYDDRDNLLSRTDPLGRTTAYAWDDRGNLTTAQHPDGSRTTITYNDFNQPLAIREAGGARLRYSYDARGNRTAATNPAGIGARYAYDDRGHLAALTNSLGETVTVRCDPAGLPVVITDPLGASTLYERDAFGRPVVVTGPTGAATHLEWTPEGHLARRTGSDGTVESWTYDGEGNCTSHTDAMGTVSSIEYTHFDLMSARTGPDGVRYEFEHDAELRLRKVTNPQGLTWNYEYDPAGRLRSETDFDGHTLTYTHDAAGQLSSRTTAAGATLHFERDVFGRTVRKDVDGAVTTYAYDNFGRLAVAAGPEVAVVLQRDEAGRLISETVNDRTMTYAYDTAGRRTSRTTPSGAVSTYTYDSVGNRTELISSGRTFTFTHDEAGRELARHIGDHLTFSNSFDQLGRLTTQQVDTGTGRNVKRREYTYRPDGHVIGIADDAGERKHLEVDVAGRVTNVRGETWNESYAYDSAGNQTHASWPDHHLNAGARGERRYSGTRITQAGNIRYEYDAAGRVTLRQKTRLSRKPDTWRYFWDAEDRLTSVVTPDGTRWRYVYDPMGRRIAKQQLGADEETVLQETRFTWDGNTLAEQTAYIQGSPETLTLTWDHDGQTPISQTESKALASAPQEIIDQRFFAIVTDLVGTPTELVDEHGHIAWQARSTLWGTTGWAPSADAYTPLRFPGQYFDPETRLHYNYFRHYDPEAARYLTLDPLGLAPAPNPAAYVPNPLAWTDPLGLSPCRKTEPDDPTWDGRVRYGEPDEHGRPTAMHATLGPDMMGANPTDPHGDPPGWEKDKGYNRAHLLGAQLGGSNYDPANFVTMHAYANSPVMRHIENQVRAAVEAGETIQYSVTPVYNGSDPIPTGVKIEAHGANGFQFTQHKSTGIDGSGNEAFIPNKKRGT
ncbi:DNA/RNA non-specific endonuclease [Streptomyces monticola]|uniref:DNA/RNA non-specific endonuclease n=1 Tax=Streptomyces monticola TaxID=2666263 RepID=A0ABW2JSA8_9ACTN